MAGRSHPGTQVRRRAKPVPSGERSVGVSAVEGFGGPPSLATYLPATRSARPRESWDFGGAATIQSSSLRQRTQENLVASRSKVIGQFRTNVWIICPGESPQSSGEVIQVDEED
jgi:hypothetical protein